MRRIAQTVAVTACIVILGLVTAGPALAVPADKPVVTIGQVDVYDSGGASPDTWRTYVKVPVGGFNFTAGGDVYVTFQDVSAGTPAISGEWIKAGTGPCGPECNNYGRINYTRTLNYEYLAVCGHWLRVWAWDQVKSPRPGYGWSSRDVQVAC